MKKRHRFWSIHEGFKNLHRRRTQSSFHTQSLCFPLITHQPSTPTTIAIQTMRRTSKTPNLQSIFWSQIWKFSSNSSHPDSILAWSRTSFISVTSNWSTHIVCWISSRYGLRNLQFSVFYAVWALTLSIVALTSCIGESTVVKSHGMIWFYEFKGGVFCLFPTIDKDVD